MLHLTPEAAEQVKISAKQSESEGMPLRVAALIQEDGSYHYAIGFDDATKDEDVRFSDGGVDLVVSPASAGDVKGMTIDFVELEPGKPQFIFLNPNDPEYVPPVSEEG